MIVEAFLAAHPDARAVPLRELTGDAVRPIGPGVQLLPTTDRHDGFFYARLARREELTKEREDPRPRRWPGRRYPRRESREKNSDVTVVDSDAARLRELRDRLDIQTIQGMASHPDVLRRAGAEDADLLVAVTNSDEVNMVACQVSYSLFRTPMKIARIRANAYTTRAGFFSKEHMPIDVLINPEQVVTDQIERLIQYPGALQVVDFAHGMLQLVAVKAYPDGRSSAAAQDTARTSPTSTRALQPSIAEARHYPAGRHGHRGRRRGFLHCRAAGHQGRHE